MTYFVIEFDAKDNSRLNQEFLSDMTVSKNSIHVRDGAGVGLDKSKQYLRVMGGEEKVEAAKKLFIEKKFGNMLPAKDAQKVHDAINKEEEDAAEGMGAIFG